MRRYFNAIPAVWWLALGVEVYYLAIAFGIYEVVSGWDTLVRYAPMAEAFAAGDFPAAFHPRFCMLFQVVSGIVVWLSGLEGIMACQLVAITAWTASGVVLWYLTRRLFDESAAWWAVLLFYVGSEFFEYGCEGLRDNLRVFPMLMMCIAFIRLLSPRPGENRWTGSWIMAACLFLLALLRVDCLPICVVGLVAYAIICWRRRVLVLTIPSVVSLASATAALCAMVYGYTGYFVPAAQYVRLISGGNS